MRYRGTYKSYGFAFKTKFELQVADELSMLGVEWYYETKQLNYTQSIRGVCGDCDSTNVARTRVYTPDFVLPLANGRGFRFLEAKGLFKSTDRSKHVAIKKHDPDHDIRFVFQRDNWLTKTKKKKYSGWCEQKGFLWTVQTVPEEWLDGVKMRN